jgi:hypothetical protein
MLDWDSFLALHFPPSPNHGPIRLATDLTPDEVVQSALVRNALLVLRAAAAGPGLKLTATGNLSRAIVGEMWDRTEWPGFDKELHRRYSKVINEPEFFPLFFLRHVLVEAKLARHYKGHIKTTRAGRKALEQPNLQALPALLFVTAFWQLDLGYFSRGLNDDWPQCDIGSILWSLSVAAHEWQTRERLTRLCAVPINDLFETTWDTGSSAVEGQILRPLRWFGLLEGRDAEKAPDEVVGRRLYRKTPLFDRLLSFDIQLPGSGASRH